MVRPAEPNGRGDHDVGPGDRSELARARLATAAREHWAYLVAYATFLSRGAGADAPDVVASVYETLLRTATTNPEVVLNIESMRAYLMKAVRRSHLDAVRSAHRARMGLTAEVPEHATLDASPSRVAEGRELLAEVGRVVATLPTRQREIVTRRLEGLSMREIAEQLNVSQASVARAYYRARQTLVREVLDHSDQER